MAFLDVASILRQRFPGSRFSWVPVAAYLLRLVLHERRINAFLQRTRQLDPFEFADTACGHLGIRIRLHGLHNLPSAGRLTLCANHPTGGVDGLALLQLLGSRYGQAAIPANEVLCNIPQLQDSLVSVAVFTGRNSLGRIERMYADSPPVALFPAGRTARLRGSRLNEYPWEHSFIRKSRQYNRVIVPVHISGRNSRLFYTIWKIRRALGIPLNLEMFLLVDELLRRRTHTIHVTICPRYTAHLGDSRAHDRLHAQRLRNDIQRMSKGERHD